MTFIEEGIVGCWAVFALVWIMTSFFAKETTRRQSPRDLFFYWLPLVVGAWLIFNGFSRAHYPWGLGMYLTPGSAPFAWLGFLIVLVGLMLALWARFTLGRNWSSTVVVKQNHELVTSGPYAYVRHPIYTAFILMFLGSALWLGTLAALIGVVLVVVSCWIKLLQEETFMRAQFPEAYPAYERRVKRLIPFVL